MTYFDSSTEQAHPRLVALDLFLFKLNDPLSRAQVIATSLDGCSWLNKSTSGVV